MFSMWPCKLVSLVSNLGQLSVNGCSFMCFLSFCAVGRASTNPSCPAPFLAVCAYTPRHNFIRKLAPKIVVGANHCNREKNQKRGRFLCRTRVSTCTCARNRWIIASKYLWFSSWRWVCVLARWEAMCVPHNPKQSLEMCGWVVGISSAGWAYLQSCGLDQ